MTGAGAGVVDTGAGGRELKTGAVADGLDFGAGASAEDCSVVGGKDAAGDAAAGAWTTGVGWSTFEINE